MKSSTTHLHFFALLPLVACLSACHNSTEATVTNDARSAVTQVTISGRGFSSSLGTIPPGDKRTVAIDMPRGEHGLLMVVFTGKGGLHRASHSTYFEAQGYDLQIRIHPNLSTSLSVQVQGP